MSGFGLRLKGVRFRVKVQGCEAGKGSRMSGFWSMVCSSPVQMSTFGSMAKVEGCQVSGVWSRGSGVWCRAWDQMRATSDLWIYGPSLDLWRALESINTWHQMSALRESNHDT